MSKYRVIEKNERYYPEKRWFFFGWIGFGGPEMNRDYVNFPYIKEAIDFINREKQAHKRKSVPSQVVWAD